MDKRNAQNLEDIIDILVEHGNIYAIQSKDKTEDGIPIGKYKSKIVKAKKDGILSEEQLERLEVEGNMVWRGKAADINYMIRVLCRYGNISEMTPTQYTEQGERLGFYLRTIRHYKKHDMLTEEQILELEQAGIMWHGNQMKISDTVRKLVEKGNLQEVGPEDTVKTGEPVKRLERYAKRDYATGAMTVEQKEELTQAGMQFGKSKQLLTEREKIVKRIKYIEDNLKRYNDLQGDYLYRRYIDGLKEQLEKWQKKLSEYDEKHKEQDNKDTTKKSKKVPDDETPGGDEDR